MDIHLGMQNHLQKHSLSPPKSFHISAGLGAYAALFVPWTSKRLMNVYGSKIAGIKNLGQQELINFLLEYIEEGAPTKRHIRVSKLEEWSYEFDIFEAMATWSR
ncbi:hypothetical protein C5167_033919 [Papaver somniferum]|uniref:Uncharacterized protein n=1 Tax=Papaver somniferum TaxID=3469 RepID=A0A4Y7KEJ9_PAPSO|nr:hypothetical protein C5167_033919 [Papaver somniferum]